jgi:predicted metalloendopeptidase
MYINYKKAFKKWSEKNAPEFKIRGYEQFSPEQMFFISYGQIWCEISSSTDQLTSTKLNHSPHSFR